MGKKFLSELKKDKNNMKKQIIAALTVLEFSVSSLGVVGYAREISEFSNFKVTYSGGGSVTIQGSWSPDSQ